MASAAIMGLLRTTLQTLAGLDLPPQEVLHHLDEQAQRLGTDRMATCLYAVYDPIAHGLTIVNAGHPPPLLLHLGGRAEVLRVPSGAPIGVGGLDFEAVELDAPPGATLLLYPDGLVESRLQDVWTGIERLRERLAMTAQRTGPDHPPPLEALCDEVLHMLGPGDRDDDVALLAARFDGIAPSDVAYWFLDLVDTAPRRVRRLVRGALARWGSKSSTTRSGPGGRVRPLSVAEAMGASPWMVSDILWERIVPLLPKKERPFRYPGRKPVPDRQVLCGILFVLYTGTRWEHLPQELGFGSGMTCWRRLRDWSEAGVWQRPHEVLLAELNATARLDWSRCVVESSHVRALKGGSRRARRRSTGAGPAPSTT